MATTQWWWDFGLPPSGDGHGDGCGGGNWSSGLINSLRIRKVRCLIVTRGENERMIDLYIYIYIYNKLDNWY